MLGIDPFPRAVVLGHKELCALLMMGRSDLYEWLKDTSTGFPAPLPGFGQGRNKRPVARWSKRSVYDWLNRKQESASPGAES